MAAWREALGRRLELNDTFCIYISNPAGNLSAAPDGVCVHKLHIPKRYDFYQRSFTSLSTWSPWGRKSGPNLQFFQTIREAGLRHTESWVYQLESDVLPARPLTQLEAKSLREHMQISWVIGAENHPAVLRRLPKVFHHHLNGAALYKVGDPRFQAFVSDVWAPSLWSLLTWDPSVAYDVMTSPDCWERLPAQLRAEWQSASSKLVVHAGMGNLAGLALNKKLLTVLLEERKYWSLHLNELMARQPEFFRSTSGRSAGQRMTRAW